MAVRERLKCSACGEFIRKQGDDYDHQVLVQGHSQIESAIHIACLPTAIRPDTPWQAATQKLKQAVADAQRLGPTEREAFWEVFDRVKEQR